jgi:8-oxo-dGTP pyrophosphatase MutT (NUDIX family)
VILLRPGPQGQEVLMIQRTQSAAFLGGAYVFPGGAIDPQDTDDRVLQRILGLSPQEADARLGVPSGGIGYYVAAIRECFEEAGVLLLVDAGGAPIPAARAESLLSFRTKPFLEMLETENLFIPAGSLAYYGHWVTSPGRSRRFDARFFVGLAPQGQEGSHDENETVHHMWVQPREALERGARGEIELVFATQHTLKDIGRFDEPRKAFEYAASLPEIDTNRACRALGTDHVRADPGNAEAPRSAGDAHHRAQSRRDDRARNQFVPGRDRRSRGDRSGACS